MAERVLLRVAFFLNGKALYWREGDQFISYRDRKLFMLHEVLELVGWAG